MTGPPLSQRQSKYHYQRSNRWHTLREVSTYIAQFCAAPDQYNIYKCNCALAYTALQACRAHTQAGPTRAHCVCVCATHNMMFKHQARTISKYVVHLFTVAVMMSSPCGPSTASTLTSPIISRAIDCQGTSALVRNSVARISTFE